MKAQEDDLTKKLEYLFAAANKVFPNGAKKLL